jgi:hypothetical protein
MLSPIHLPLEEVAVHAAHGALMEVDDTSALIVGDLKGIFCQQLRTHQICLVNYYYVTISLAD